MSKPEMRVVSVQSTSLFLLTNEQYQDNLPGKL